MMKPKIRQPQKSMSEHDRELDEFLSRIDREIAAEEAVLRAENAEDCQTLDVADRLRDLECAVVAHGRRLEALEAFAARLRAGAQLQ